MQPAKGPDPGEAGGQGVLQEAAHELQGFQLDGSELTGFALAIGPLELALWQQLNLAV
jgi:hypothetical protein